MKSTNNLKCNQIFFQDKLFFFKYFKIRCWKSKFAIFLNHVIIPFKNILKVPWNSFNLTNFVSPYLKLHNRYCHSRHGQPPSRSHYYKMFGIFCRENQHFVTGLLNTFLKFNNTRPLYGWVKNIKRCFEGRRKFCKGNKYLICFEFKLLQFLYNVA